MRWIALLVCLFAVTSASMLYRWSSDGRASALDLKAAELRIANATERDRFALDFSDLENLKVLPEQISDMADLIHLNISGTSVVDLGPLASLPRLEILTLRRTQVTDLSPLLGISSLNSLDVGESWVFDLEPLASLPSLQRLDIGTTAIKSLEPVSRIPQLNWLNLYSSYSHDGSKQHYLALQDSGVSVFNGNAYKQNYVPGWQYKIKAKLNRHIGEYWPKAENKSGAKSKHTAGDKICAVNQTQLDLYFAYEREEAGRMRGKITPRSKFCTGAHPDATLTVSAEKYGPEYCAIQVTSGVTYTLTKFTKSANCVWNRTP